MASNDDAAEPAPKRQRGDRVTLDVGGEKFVCGSSTLTSSSAYFASLLSDNWIESNGGDEIFLDQDPAAFRKLLAFMRRGMIKIEDVDIDVLTLAEFLGIETLVRGVKVRWYCNLGRGPLVSGKTGEEIAALFDQIYGGITSAVSQGLFPCFKDNRSALDYESDLAELRVELGEPGELREGLSRCTCVTEVNGDNPTRIECSSIIGAFNGLFASGYEVTVGFDKKRIIEGVVHFAFSRRRHSALRSDAANIFIPDYVEAQNLRKGRFKTQFACWARGEDRQQILVAPAEFSANERHRENQNAYAVAILGNAGKNWMWNNGFSTRAALSFEQTLKYCMNGFEKEGYYKFVELCTRRVPVD